MSSAYRIQERWFASKAARWQRSRARWREARPNADLTWGSELTGDAFVDKAIEWGAFGAERSIVEIGPGYGRLLKSCIRRDVQFRSYRAIDISSANIEWLRATVHKPGVSFLLSDAESVHLESPFDVLLSSLTFKHFYPTFEEPLRNIAGYGNPGALFIVDLREGTTRLFETDGVTYIRCYTKTEIRSILERVGLDLVAFDSVAHDEAHRRLLLVARKPEAIYRTT